MVIAVLVAIAATSAESLRAAPPVVTSPGPPRGLMVELLTRPADTVIRQATPGFSWIVDDSRRGAKQLAWRIVVELAGDPEPRWDSGQVTSSESIDVRYAGPPLSAGTSYRWKVMTWDAGGIASPWSEYQTFRTADVISAAHSLAPADRANNDFANRHALIVHEQAPVESVRRDDGSWFFDFGRAAFGNLVIRWTDAPRAEIDIQLGEMLSAPARIEPRPPGSVRFQSHRIELTPDRNEHLPTLTWSPPGWMREGFISVPRARGQVMPFRYAEIENPPPGFRPEMISRRWLAYPLDEQASHFASSRDDLDAIWELCKYSIQATSFLGIYVDGDRERKPYEADTFIGQMCHYAIDREYSLARHSHEFLLQHSTWPLEWQPHSVLIAWEDYLHTGNARSLEACYDRLADKTLVGLAREDGLIDSSRARQTPALLASLNVTEPLKTLIDWPPGERDGHQIGPVDAVANAFHYRSLVLMAKIATELKRPDAAKLWTERAERVGERYQQVFFNPETGLYRDGEGRDHSSLHANLFPLLFGLVPQDFRPGVIEHVKGRGNRGSVYAAYHLLDALYQHGQSEYALAYLTSRSERSWHNMLAKGSTITMEAWDQTFKTNQDWNHAWGAAPAAVIPKRLVGVRPLEPGYRRILVDPQPGSLDRFDATVPTIRGPVQVVWRRSAEMAELSVTVPANCTAELRLPTDRAGEILEAGRPLGESTDVSLRGSSAGSSTIEIPSGSYQFRFPVR